MNRFLKYCFLPVLALAACKKDTRVFDESPDVRVQKTLTAFQKELVDAGDGWKATIFPRGGKGFSYWMKFDAANRVTMVCDFNTTTATTSKTSSYRLKALEQPSLMFDTYGYIHLPADPSGSVSGGTNGAGLASDFEFALLEGLIDSLRDHPGTITQMNLFGRFNGVPIQFSKATAAEATAYNAGGLNTLMTPVIAYVNANKYLFVKLGDDKRLQVAIDLTRRNLTLAWEVDGIVSNSASPFAYTLTGIILQKPVEYNGKKIYELTWDNTDKILFAMVDGAKVKVEVSPSPILPLHLILGSGGFSTIVPPNATTFPGWSDDFKTRRAAAAAAMLTGGFGLRMDRMLFAFNTTLKTMVLTVDIYQGANKFIATFNYTYTKTQTGVFKFAVGDPVANANGNLIIGNMAPLLAQRLNVDQFTMDYFVDPTYGTLGQFISVENPGFTFTGTFQ
jgi:hypothetical protein